MGEDSIPLANDAPMCHRTRQFQTAKLLDLCCLIHDAAQDVTSLGTIPMILVEAFGLPWAGIAWISRKPNGDEMPRLIAKYPTENALPKDRMAVAKITEETAAQKSEIDRGMAIQQQISADDCLTLTIPEPRECGLNSDQMLFFRQACLCAGRSLGLTLEWLSYTGGRTIFQEPLTRREWEVLCGLCTNPDMSEKQLAGALGMSASNLHSYVKTLYRKLKVPGRLPMIQRFRAAHQKYRLKRVAMNVAAGAKPLDAPLARLLPPD